MPRSPKRSGEMHLLLALSGMALAGTLMLGTIKGIPPQEQTAPPLDIAVEHALPLTLTITASATAGRGIVELTTDGTETVRISVPETWERREVRGAPLEKAPGEPAAMGFRRWTIPAGATLSFWVSDAPRLRIQNPSGKPLLVEAKRVNVKTGSVAEQTTLIKDVPLVLW